MEYLGSWVTHIGIKPPDKKIETINNMTPTTTRKAFNKFIGLVNYYNNVWARLSHML